MTKINTYEARILTILIKSRRYLTTGQVARRSGISWNTALKYLKSMNRRKWVTRMGNRTLYWRARIHR